MRTTQIEELPPAQFILLIGLVAGFLNGMPSFLAENDDRVLRFVVYVRLALLWLGGCLLWWVAVRRWKFSVWRTAWHVTLGLALGDLMSNALAFVAASIQTDGDFVNAYVQAPLTTTLLPLLILTLIRALIWLLESAGLVALGRILAERLPPLLRSRTQFR